MRPLGKINAISYASGYCAHRGAYYGGVYCFDNNFLRRFLLTIWQTGIIQTFGNKCARSRANATTNYCASGAQGYRSKRLGKSIYCTTGPPINEALAFPFVCNTANKTAARCSKCNSGSSQP